MPVHTRILDKKSNFRDDLKVELRSSKPKIASFDEFGNLIAHKKGDIRVVATHGKLKQSYEVSVLKNPVVELEMSTLTPEARTGDVIKFQLVPRDKSGKEVLEVPVKYCLPGNRQ